MWIRRKHRNRRLAIQQTVSDRLAIRIATATIKIQVKIASAVNDFINRLATTKLKLALAIFTIFAGGYSIYLIVNVITTGKGKSAILKIEAINKPIQANRTGEKDIQSQNSIDEETFKKINGIRKYMDSLKEANSFCYDSIMTVRPGLMDSVLILENIYYSQNKNENK